MNMLTEMRLARLPGFVSKARVRPVIGFSMALFMMASYTCHALTIPFIATGPLSAARESHTATLLPDGRVLVAGGVGSSGSYISSAELYNPSNGTWTATGSMAAARRDHSATLLPNGKVLVAGGYDGGSSFSSAELYDPSNGTWTATGSMAAARSSHTATLLPDGRVLVAGGVGSSGSYISSAELYNPSGGTWTATGSMAAARGAHIATLLPDGKVFVAGGLFYGGSGVLSSAELYDSSKGKWVATSPMAAARYFHKATLLPDGRVLVAGGFYSGSGVLSSAELYAPSNGTWTATVPMVAARGSHTATLLPNGKVLVAGGYGGGNVLSSAELYGCTVTFDATGGIVVPSTKTYYSGSDAYGRLPLSLRPGYIFNGWWTQPDGPGTRFTESELLTTNIDHTAYAGWLPDAYLVNRVSSVTVIGNTNAVRYSDADSGDGGTSIELGGVGLLGDGQMAGVEWSATGPGILSFDWKVSSEQDYDWLGFYEAGAATTNRISGTGGSWARMTLNVGGTPSDSHTFRWDYSKDPIGDSVGEDCGLIDAISWSPIYALAVNGGSGGGAYTNCTAVPITAAAPAAHYAFDRWIGDTNTVADVFAPETTVTMPAFSIGITASYKPVLYTLAVASGSGGGSYTYASAVVIGATPYADKRFYRWTGDVETVVDVASATTTVVTAGHTLSVAATYIVPLTVNGGTGGGWYLEGATASVTANADPLYKEFAVWTGDAAGLLDAVAARTASLTIPTRPSELTATYRDTIARVAGCYGRTTTTAGTSGGVSADAASGSPSGTPAVKLGGAGVVPDNGFAAFETAVSGSGTVMFWWRVSSESNADYLKFKVDGANVATISGTKGPWVQVTNRVEGAGVLHTMRWEYAKNGSLASSTDAGWVDDIIWTGDIPEPVIAPDIHAVAAADGLFSISFLGERGIPYAIYSNATLNASGWAPMATVPQEQGETNGLFRFLATVVPNSAQGSCFYRMFGGVIPPPPSPTMVLVQGGSLTNISNGAITVSSFYIGKYEVTWAEWQTVRDWAATNGYDIGNIGEGSETNHPVQTVSWYDCMKWCNARSQKEGHTPVYYMDAGLSLIYKANEVLEPFVNASATGYRLPTAAEWEFACRGGTQSQGYEYSGGNNLYEVGWFSGNSGGSDKVVGTKVANELGLYDMSGNVLEWCFDWYPGYEGLARVFRGGSWYDNAYNCRSAIRFIFTPDSRGYSIGFRAARTLP